MIDLTLVPAVALAAIFAALSAIHWYWAFGGRRGFEAAVPTSETGEPLINPGPVAASIVALVLLAGGVLVLWQAGILAWQRFWFTRAGVWGVAAVFFIRAVGDFRTCGFFKRARNTRFARYDTYLFSPLCMLVAGLAAWLALSPCDSPRNRRLAVTHHIIRTIQSVHCKRGPEVCEVCREMNEEKICLLDIEPPDRGLVQRRVIEVELGDETVWREYDVVRAFETAQEARDFATQHGIMDVAF